ncbi:nickel/cobalt transporter [Daeguia caeni]|uniref:Nickel/cobalt efflux system n=1 Tax=Daeguia caeni TaxID=439612 RepID=A0ABV9H5B1_9HYPH
MRKIPPFILGLCLFLLALQASAQSSLGIGANEVAMQPTGPFAHLIYWINAQQRSFYLAMTGALKAMREDPWKASILVGLSFIYGIFHASGPGHGKAVISSYMIANETALKRGVLLSFVSSLLQAVVAIAVVGGAYLLLRGSGISMNSLAHYLEVASFGLILLFGLWLLLRKVVALFSTQAHENAAIPASSARAQVWEGTASSSVRSAIPANARLKYQPAHGAADHVFIGEGSVCAACGSAHIADPGLLQDAFDWKTAWSAIIAVGLRPCSGALIVFTFALLNGLVWGGILSVFAMALGTFITVALLATLAVTAKNVVLKFAGHGRLSSRLKAAIEIAAALFITLMGALLLSAALVS